MKQLSTILICLMLITACTRNKTSETAEAAFSIDDYLHVVDLNKNRPTNIKLSELFASATPIILETTQQSLIGAISKAIITPEYIIVLDKSIAKALFLFKKDGTFLHKFGRVGNGSGEYSRISDFCYDETTGTIYMFTQRGRINLYNIHTGDFLKSIQLISNNGISRHIYYHAGELYVDLSDFSNKNEKRYLLNRINQSTGKVEEAWLDLEIYAKNIDYINNDSFLFGDENSFKFHTFFMDGIILFEQGKITPFLAFTPEYTLNSNDLQGMSLENIGSSTILELYKIDKVINISTYVEHKDLLFMQFKWGGIEDYTFIYNQKTKDFKIGSIFDDFIFKTYQRFFTHLFVAHDDNGMYIKFEYNQMNNLRNFLKNDQISDNFKGTATDLVNLEEDANPVLLYYKFKD